MSEVRMCDICGTVFSVRTEDWQSMTMRNNNPGNPDYKNGQVTIDVCSRCGFSSPAPALKAPSDLDLYTPKGTAKALDAKS